MKIDLHMIMYNEEKLLPLILDYYNFCNIFLYDNGSTDSSVEIGKSYGATISTFGSNVFSDKDFIEVKNNCWKGSSADWVIVCDTDEIFYRKNLLETLKSDKSTIIKPKGFDHYSNDFPENILDIKTGFFSAGYNKCVCFKPSHITEINYTYGCHTCKPKGRVVWSRNTYYLRHFRCIGGADMLVERHKMYLKRFSDFNKKSGLSSHYLYAKNAKKGDINWDNIIKNKCIIFPE